MAGAYPSSSPSSLGPEAAKEAAPPAGGSPAGGDSGAGAAGVGDHLDAKRALMRKVAQLTKVVVHLNARNDEAETRYERLRKGFEDEACLITQDAALKIAAHRKRFGELVDPALLKDDLDSQMVASWSGRRGEAARALQAIRDEAAAQQERLVEQAQSRVRSTNAELRTLTAGIHRSLDAFRDVAGRSRADLEQKDTELRDRRAEELRSVAAEHQRRLDDLRSAHARDLEHVTSATDQALAHLRRMHESELITLRMQLLQKRQDKVHRLEQDFGEERRSIEQTTAHMGFELEQQHRDAGDVEASCVSMQQQVDSMRGVLEEMTRRTTSAEAEAQRAADEANEKEAEVAALQGEVAVLQARQRAAGVGDAPAPPARRADQGQGQPDAAAAGGGRGAGADLSEDLREVIALTKQLEGDLGNSDAELADLEDELTEKEKQVEIFEVEVEEEQLRTHQLQARILEREAALKA